MSFFTSSKSNLFSDDDILTARHQIPRAIQADLYGYTISESIMHESRSVFSTGGIFKNFYYTSSRLDIDAINLEIKVEKQVECKFLDQASQEILSENYNSDQLSLVFC